jgi:glycosyltransferase involved in cell wall biosynthesis
MACLIKAPDASGKGCVSFTTPERDQFIKKDSRTRAAVEALKSQYVIGLHHNWHDHGFVYDPLFDFSMAGEGDLIERDQTSFARVNVDACSFAPSFFGSAPRSAPYWDVLNVSRAVGFKGTPEFLKAIRAIYDRGRFIRVLHLCPVPPAEGDGTTLHDIRQSFEALFLPTERRFFSLITMEWDYPFPLDLETLAFFYRSSRVYVHPAPDERRSRTASYAWADRMPVVASENVASILPPDLRRPPFLYEFGEPEEIADTILKALDSPGDDPRWDNVAEEFLPAFSGKRLGAFLDELAERQGYRMSRQPINFNGFDIRLGRHHNGLPGPNGMRQDLVSFCRALKRLGESDLASAVAARDPEACISEMQAFGRMAWLPRNLAGW